MMHYCCLESWDALIKSGQSRHLPGCSYNSALCPNNFTEYKLLKLYQDHGLVWLVLYLENKLYKILCLSVFLVSVGESGSRKTNLQPL